MSQEHRSDDENRSAAVSTVTEQPGPTGLPGAIRNLGWQVTMAGLGINLALGILYTWSVIKKGVPADWLWTDAQKTLPYSTAVLVFSLMMVPAGRLQDRIGPRFVATIGGLLVSLGLILCGLAGSPYVQPVAQWIAANLMPGVPETVIVYFVGFGLLAGTGIGFGYASATPPAVKWFPAARTGMIAGLVVSGFGLASVWAAPLTEKLIAVLLLPNTLIVLGVAFLVVVVGLSQLLQPPPKGYVPPAAKSAASGKKQDFRPGEMLRSPQFYLCWITYAIGAGAGLMVISQLAAAVAKQASIEKGFYLVAACAVGNGAGRIITGTLSDKWGRQRTLLGCFLFQAVLLLVLSTAEPGAVAASLVSMLIISALIGANYGANLAIYPAITKDFYGLKNFGVNYGLVFTAWGLGGFTLAQVASKIYDHVGKFTYNYYGVAALLVLAALVILTVKPPRPAG